MVRNALVVLAGFLLMVIAYAAFEMFVPVRSGNKNIEVEIPRGATFRQAADVLWKERLIRDKKIFLALGRLTGADRKIRAGFYSFWSNMSPLDIFSIIRKGRIIEFELRVIEGDSLYEIAETFAKAGLVSEEEFMELVRDPGILASHDIEAQSMEGYLYPDTYIVPKGIKAEDALDIMLSRMKEKFSPEIAARAEALGMTKTGVLTLASIIEKEAVADEERPVISAVYHNRLRKGMPLQADPTSIYGIKSSKERITKADLQRKTPYNTYVIKGLPPGPIASPGLKSMIAAVNPAQVPYLYFVSNNDGTHNFSISLNEHEAAVRAYREKKRTKEEG
ncbi:MAG: endolytic transglycosylase MltG [Nitrospiraceae bacterium]|nr:endolytic transglycosylase MltG [Nitrospiraceae bacterium]